MWSSTNSKIMRRDCRKWGGMLVFSKNYLKKFFFFAEGTQMIHKWWLPVGIPLRHSLHLGIYSTCPQSQKVSISISILWAGLATFQRESWDSETSVRLKRAFFFFFFNCLMAALGLHCCSWTFSSCGQGEMPFAVVMDFLSLRPGGDAIRCGEGLSLAAARGRCHALWFEGFSLWWLLLLWSTG